MAWIVGVDEAGYGPSLGPFVMSLVACRVPDTLVDADLWDHLKAAVRKGKRQKAGDPRVHVDDSKIVHSAAGGLAGLERGVLALLGCDPSTTCLADFLGACCIRGLDDLAREVWYQGASQVPCTVPADDLASARTEFQKTCLSASVDGWRVHTVIVPAPRFNDLVETAGSKGAVLADSFGVLLRQHALLDGDDPVHFCVDKHGGRNTYAAVIQHALEEGMVMAREEGALRSTYQVIGLPRQLHLTFQPRADAGHFCVALASMASKYLRERLMEEFNQFWAKHLPGLVPTAGYPNDALRFFEAIKPTIRKLGLTEASLWRAR